MEIGNVVCYGSSGVCSVVDIRKEDVLGNKVEYYVLVPVNDSKTTIFVPTASEKLTSRMLPLLNKAEINDLILSMHNSNFTWITDNRTRKDVFQHTISSGSRSDVAGMLHCIYTHKKNLAASGKSLHSSDMIFFKQAQSRIFSEIAFVMGISIADVPEYISSLISE